MFFDYANILTTPQSPPLKGGEKGEVADYDYKYKLKL